MARFRNFFARFATLTVLSLALAACGGGDDGQDGATGSDGPAGPPGPPGPSTGSGIPIGSTELINIAVSSVAIPSGGGAPVVSLTLSNDLEQGLRDLPAADIRFTLAQLSPGSGGGSSEWQSYITREDGGIADVQANAEKGSAGTFIDNSDGTYQYTFANDLTAYPAGPVFDETKTHRLGIEIRGQAPISSNGIITFVPAGGVPLFERLIVNNDTCNACHDRLEFHGGPRTDVEYCVTCHNPSSTDGDTGNTVDMKALVHNIHSARTDYQIKGYGPNLHDWSDLIWTQDIRNCDTCHQESDPNTPQASNWRLVPNRAACGTCHYDDGDDTNGRNDYMIQDGEHPLGLVMTDDTQCISCHGPDSTIGDGSIQVAKAHEIPTQIESKRFQYNIGTVTDMAVGSMPTVELSVTNPLDGTYYDILNDSEFTTCAFGASRLQVGIAWNTADYTNTGSGAAPAQPIGISALPCFGAAGSTPVAGSPGVFSVTATQAIPAGAIGTAAVTIDGHPAVVIDGSVNRIPVKNVVKYVGIDGADAMDRREVVDIANCDNCHKELSLHGNNRTDNPQVCVTCHNPNATDAAKRVQAPPDEDPYACETELGLDDVSIDFKFMIHAMHASGHPADDIGAQYDVCGYGFSAHSFNFVTPGKVENCEGCHDQGTYYPVDPAMVLGTTIDAGEDLSSPVDDTVVSPNTSVCSACHVSSLAAEHMKQNGGDYEATKAADSTLISSGVETCALCHGEGGIADVETVHHVRDFPLN
jgi:OmcA/MtrC family decaheme c-type cytochrome